MTRVLAMVMLIVAGLAAPLVAETQPAGKVYRIGWLHPVTMPPTWMEAMRQGLRHHGYIEGRNLAVDYQFGDGRFERLPWRRSCFNSSPISSCLETVRLYAP
jgi:putative tryptophan/tyrosine transport system substrate-binding protein